MNYFCDDARHLVCSPYSREGLHSMAHALNIGRHWFHGGRLAHYDIPKRRAVEIMAKCTVDSSAEILNIIRGRAS